VPLLLDTGMAHGFLLTDQAPEIAMRVERMVEERNADESHRGTSQVIRVDSLEVLGARFADVAGTRADWRMFSSEPFSGAVGLDFFLHRRVTLDYRGGRIGVSSAPLPAADTLRDIVLDLVPARESQGHLLYVRAVVHGRPALVYLDTGYSASWIDPGFTDGLTVTAAPGRHPATCRGVPVTLGGRSLVLDDVRVEPVRRGEGFELPVALVLGSDVLSRFLVTVDLPGGRLVLTPQAR
jgi:hypothetical protein